MPVSTSSIQYRVTPEQLDELRDAMDDLDENLRIARRNMERLTNLRAEIPTQQVGVTEAK